MIQRMREKRDVVAYSVHIFILSVVINLMKLTRYIREEMFVEVGEGMSPNFEKILESLRVKGENLAFAPDTEETRTMINLMSIKFPLLKVPIVISEFLDTNF